MSANWGAGAGGAVKGAGTGALLGSVVPGVGTGIGAGVGAGIGGLMGLLGGGGDDPANNVLTGNAGYQSINRDAAAQANDADLQSQLAQVRNPGTSSAYAAQQVKNNPLFGGMFGKGGYQDQLQNEHQNLSQNGYSLTPQDHEAYGQASDDAARMFGQQGNQVSSMLASHGLAAGGSGGAGVAFSGLAGNQNEQLAQAQRNIAGDRMNMNLQRLNSVRGAISNTQAQAQSALNSQQDNNQRGVDNYNHTQQMSLGAGESMQNEINNQYAQAHGKDTASFGSVLGGAGATALGSYAGGLGSHLASTTSQSPTAQYDGGGGGGGGGTGLLSGNNYGGKGNIFGVGNGN